MKKFKGLNNKGFTLIELLAVIVILAVVMAIASTSVISAMNNSRKSSLQDSAKAVQQAFQTKYSEALVLNSANDVYKGVISGYNFTDATSSTVAAYYLATGLSNELNLSSTTYNLATSAGAVTLTNAQTNSFIMFDGNAFVACLSAKNSGNMFVSNDTFSAATTKTILKKSVKFAANTMWACSDGTTSW